VSVRTIGRVAVALAVAMGFLVTGPVAQAAPATDGAPPVTAFATAGGLRPLEAPWGEQCGAYFRMRKVGSRDEPYLYYKHCGDTKIKIEIDIREHPNEFRCIDARFHSYVYHAQVAEHAWYAGSC
jgi:hypothetical protein